MAEKIICKQCFYNYRTFPSISCKHRNEVDVYHVRWNEANQQLETTAQSIRPLPQLLVQKPVWNVRMCDPYTCKRDKCTFAHGEAERKKWQKLCRGCYSKQICCHFDFITYRQRNINLLWRGGNPNSPLHHAYTAK